MPRPQPAKLGGTDGEGYAEVIRPPHSDQIQVQGQFFIDDPDKRLRLGRAFTGGSELSFVGALYDEGQIFKVEFLAQVTDYSSSGSMPFVATKKPMPQMPQRKASARDDAHQGAKSVSVTCFRRPDN